MAFVGGGVSVGGRGGSALRVCKRGYGVGVDRVCGHGSEDGQCRCRRRMCAPRMASYGARFGVSEEEEEMVAVERDVRAVEGLLRAGYLDQAFKRYRHLHETNRIRLLHYFKCIKIFGEYDSLKSAWMVYRDLCNEECKVDPDLKAHNLMMRLSANKRDTAKVKLIYERMRNTNVQPDLTTFRVFIGALAHVGELRDAENAMETMEALEIRPDVHTLRTMMRAYSAKNNITGVKVCYNRMLLLGLRPDQITYNMYIDAVGRRESLEEAEAAFAEMQRGGKSGEARPDVVTYNTLIKLQTKRGRMDMAKKYYRMMLTRGIRPNEITFTTLLSALCNEGDLTSAKAAFTEMERRGIRPQINHYNALLGLHLERRDHGAIHDLYLDIRRLGYRPNAHTYNLVLTTYMRDQRDLEAIALFEDMRLQHVRPDRNTFSLLQRLRSHINDVELAKKWFNRMQLEGVSPGEVNYAVLLEVLVKAGQLDDAQKLVDAAARADVKPKTRLNGAILRLAAARRDLEGGKELAKTFFKNAKDWRVEKVDLESLLISLCDLGAADEALKASEMMVARGWEPSPRTRQRVARLSARGSGGGPLNPEEEVKPFVEMINRFGQMRDGLRAKRAFDRMLQEHVEPTVSVFNALILASSLAADIEQALMALDELKRSRSLSPTEASFRPIVLALLRAKRVVEAKSLLREAAQCGIKVNLPRPETARDVATGGQPGESKAGDSRSGPRDSELVAADRDEEDTHRPYTSSSPTENEESFSEGIGIEVAGT